MRAATMPTWFRAATVILILWNLMGAYACLQQFRLGAEAMGPSTAYDRALFAALPIWYDWVFALAEAAGVAGAIALPLLIVSLLAVVGQFGYLFATSDIIAVKGVWTAYFPAFILAMCVVQVALARMGIRRGWLT